MSTRKTTNGRRALATQTTRTTNGRTKRAVATQAASAIAPERQLAILTESLETLIRADASRLHGYQYGTDRDIYAVGGYERHLDVSHYANLYERDGIAGQIVDMPAEATWRKAPEIIEKRDKGADKKKLTEFEQAWSDLTDRLGIWGRLERADKLARIGRFGVLLIGVAGDDSDLRKPLPIVSGPEGVLYLSAFREGIATVATWVTDPLDPRFGMPESYKIDLSSGQTGFRPQGQTGGSQTVHWSRVIHIAEGLLEDEVYGRPALQRVWNDLHDFQKVATSTGEAFWQRVAGILQAITDPAANITEEQMEALDEKLQLLVHDLRRTFTGHGVELKRLAETEPDPGPAANLYMTRIAAGAGIPKRMLFGSETGERASGEDQKTYLGSIAERQTSYAEPIILRPLIDRLVSVRALPRPGKAGYEVVWPALFSESEDTIATANLKRAQAAQALTPIGGSAMDLVEVDEERSIWLRPTGERGELTPEELEPPEPPAPVIPGQPGGEQPDPDAPEA